MCRWVSLECDVNESILIFGMLSENCVRVCYHLEVLIYRVFKSVRLSLTGEMLDKNWCCMTERGAP